MTAFIGNLIAEAASSAMRGVGIGQAALVVRPDGWRAPTIRNSSPPIILDLCLIRIEVNIKL